jgi:hypothetical protein
MLLHSRSSGSVGVGVGGSSHPILLIRIHSGSYHLLAVPRGDDGHVKWQQLQTAKNTPPSRQFLRSTTHNTTTISHSLQPPSSAVATPGAAMAMVASHRACRATYTHKHIHPHTHPPKTHTRARARMPPPPHRQHSQSHACGRYPTGRHDRIAPV